MKIDTFIQLLQQGGIHFFTGTLNSVFQPSCPSVKKLLSPKQHIITANEGAAVAIALGHYMATREVPLVYLQASGIGNIINSITSLSTNYQLPIPMLLLVERRENCDEEEKTVTSNLIKAMQLNEEIFVEGEENLEKRIQTIVTHTVKEQQSTVIVVDKGFFKSCGHTPTEAENNRPLREEAIDVICKHIDINDRIVATTRMVHNELEQCCIRQQKEVETQLPAPHYMRHAAHIALGLALASQQHKILCFDTDEIAIMQPGAMAVIGNSAPENFLHIIFNDGTHENVGKRNVNDIQLRFARLAEAFGYNKTYCVESVVALDAILPIVLKEVGPVLLEIKVKKAGN